MDNTENHLYEIAALYRSNLQNALYAAILQCQLYEGCKDFGFADEEGLYVKELPGHAISLVILKDSKWWKTMKNFLKHVEENPIHG